MINAALDSVRKRVMRRFEHNKKSDEYYLLKYRRNLLFTDYELDAYSTPKYNHHFKYAVSDSTKLEMMLAIDLELSEAYNLKESYIFFNSKEYDAHIRQEVLDSLISRFLDSEVIEFNNVGETLLRWRKEILNSFSTITKKIKTKDGSSTSSFRVSNGPIEGRNKYINTILRLANGYSNFQRFRKRCMYCLNRFETHSQDKLSTPVRKSKRKTSVPSKRLKQNYA